MHFGKANSLFLLLPCFMGILTLSAYPSPDVGLNSVDCVDSMSWSSTSFHPRQCVAAIHAVYEFEVLTSARITYEFLASGATRSTVAAVQRTPRRYVGGSCTLAIVLLKDVPSLGSTSSAPSSDLTDYWQIWKLSKSILEDCLPPWLSGNRSSNVGRSHSPVKFRSQTGWGRLVSVGNIDT